MKYFTIHSYTKILIIKLLFSIGEPVNITFANGSICNFIINDSQLCKITRNLCNSSKEEPIIIIDGNGEVEFFNSANNDLVNFDEKKAVKLEDTKLAMLIFMIVACLSMIYVLIIIRCICNLTRKQIFKHKEMEHTPLVENELSDNKENSQI